VGSVGEFPVELSLDSAFLAGWRAVNTHNSLRYKCWRIGVVTLYLNPAWLSKEKTLRLHLPVATTRDESMSQQSGHVLEPTTAASDLISPSLPKLKLPSQRNIGRKEASLRASCTAPALGAAATSTARHGDGGGTVLAAPPTDSALTASSQQDQQNARVST
jgi:hypothetical protein